MSNRGKKRLALAIVIASFFGTYFLGWRAGRNAPVSIPAKIVEVDKTREIREQLTAISVRLDNFIRQESSESRESNRQTIERFSPDGKVTYRKTHTGQRKHVQASQQTQQTSATAQVVHDKDRKERETRIVIEPLLPKWRLSFDTRARILDSERLRLIYGGRVERRLFHNFWGGIYATSEGVAGLAISAEFQ